MVLKGTILISKIYDWKDIMTKPRSLILDVVALTIAFPNDSLAFATLLLNGFHECWCFYDVL